MAKTDPGCRRKALSPFRLRGQASVTADEVMTATVNYCSP